MSLSQQDMLQIYEVMLLIRESEARTVSLFKKGELQHGHVLPCLGQEAIPAAFSNVLKPTDYVKITTLASRLMARTAPGTFHNMGRISRSSLTRRMAAKIQGRSFMFCLAAPPSQP